MKKKTLPLLMLIAGLSTAALAACGHDHKYEWKNSEDGTTHWQECACGEKLEDSEGLHVDVKNNDTNADGPDYKCDECGVHVHKYEWKSDADNHWQECVEEGKINEGKHVDVKNNSTNAPTPDYKCDDCGREATVRFNMLGHGLSQTPDNLYIDLGGKVPALDLLEDDDCWKFTGWYKNAACTDPFDFDTPIDKVTQIYAGWEEDTTPGASRTHAYVLDGEHQLLEAAKPGEVVFFKFTAPKEGRYTVAQGAGTNSENSTFKTTLTGDDVYGEGHDSNVTFDMDKNQTVYVLFSYLGEGGSDATAGVILTETTDEPLPEDYFLDGDYFNDVYSFSFDRAKKELTVENGGGALNEGQKYLVKYVGGKFDRIYFDVTTENEESGETTTTTHYIKHNNNGTYSYTNDASTGGASLLAFAELQPPVALEKVFGYYKPSGNATNGITELYIYESESEESTYVLYKQDGIYHEFVYATYDTDAESDTAKNRLTFGDYSVTLNLSEDKKSVVSINVIGVNNGVMRSNTYNLEGAAGVTRNLPLYSDYYGEDYAIRTEYGSLYFGAEGHNKITVLNYVESTDTYTVAVSAGNSFVNYKLKVVFDEYYEVVSIELYDNDGTKLDSLTPFKYIYHELPTTSTNVSLAASDFQKGQIYIYKVMTGGWYQFTNVPEGVQIYYNLDTGDPFVLDYAKPVGSDAVSLAGPVVWDPEDPDSEVTYALVGVFVNEPAAVSFTVAPGSAPAGWNSNDPKILENGSATLENADNTQDFHFRFVAPEAGSYRIHVYYGENHYFYTLSYTINDNVYGQDGDYQWLGGVTEENPYAVVSTPEDSLNIDIAVRYNSSWNDKIDITVVVMGDYSANASDVTLEGEPAEGSLTLSATVTAGTNYHLASDTHKTNVTATANAAFTVKTQSGASLDAVEDGGKFVVSIPFDTEYFTVVSATSGLEVTLSQTFTHGDIGYPFVASAAEGANTLTVGSGTTFFTLPAGMYSIEASSAYRLSLYIGETPKDFGVVFTVEEGDLLYCRNLSGEEVTLTITEAIPVFTADQAGTYEGTYTGMMGTPTATASLTFDIFGNGTFTVTDAPMAPATEPISITAGAESGFTFTYFDYNLYEDVTVTFTFNEGALELTCIALNGGNPFTMEKKAVSLGGTYVGVLGGVDIKMEIDGDTVKIYVDMGSGWEREGSTTLSESDGTYTFSDKYGETVTFTVTDENTLACVHTYYGSGTLTKEA